MMNEAHALLLSREAATQDQSPLFSKLPGEVRGLIFAFALSDYPDPNKQFDPMTCYARPSYFAPRKTDIELLRTCRAVYRECWHMPFALREQVHWATEIDRAPPGFWSQDSRLAERLSHITELQGETEIDSLRIFAQMYKLEQGDVAALLRTPFLHPRSVTLTIRHADWWFWESDTPLYFEGSWIQSFCEAMSSSVCEIHLELESLQRKKRQVDDIAKQMAERWCFKRRDGAVLYADTHKEAFKVSQWSGTSTWHNRRWIRDETEPDRIDYYIVTVSFRLESIQNRRGATVSEGARETARRGYSNTERLKLRVPWATRIASAAPSIYVGTTDLIVRPVD
ncbi:hypothetical protein HIM_09707 [Hirsutella minnesotensis 3608]|uniref:Uncharacterized protein n=1 Tax=Hirsutella minnesotensis 3608 TaxID=1043627 RepID=A0A0F8A2Z0_9HYPO|nr:hypothetical protein HIM_09707 [Hirsutella minnesotensis 3608]